MAKTEFEHLREKVSRNEALTESETETFCLGIHLTQHEKLDNYPCCEDYKFYMLYLVYFRNIAGGIIYYKLDREAVRWRNEEAFRQGVKTLDDLKPTEIEASLYEISNDEAERGLEYLYNVAETWEGKIKKENHRETLLQEVSKEARGDLKEFERENKNNFIKGFKYLKERRTILLRSKYVDLKVKKILENNGSAEYVVNLLGEDVHITSSTLIHIINRHYAAITRHNFSAKTYHNEDVNPQYLHILLKAIFDIINTSFITNKVNLNNIMFGYNERVYMLFTKIEQRSVKGQGNVSYRRVKTLYPIPAHDVKKEIDRGCIVYKLRANVFFYYRPYL